jgi:hypothetical protein
MLTGLALLVRGPRYIPYGWVFVVVVIALILVIFIRVYGKGDRSQSRTKDRSEKGTVHHVTHVTEQGGNHEHRPRSKRRPKRSRSGKRQLATVSGRPVSPPWPI